MNLAARIVGLNMYRSFLNKKCILLLPFCLVNSFHVYLGEYDSDFWWEKERGKNDVEIIHIFRVLVFT